MQDELKYLMPGIVKTAVQPGRVQINESVLSGMQEPENWVCVANKHSIINQSSLWCFEYLPTNLNNYDPYFLQIELQTEFKTVVAINVITNEKNKVTTYS